MFGSVERLAFSSDEISIAESASRKSFIIVSFIVLVWVYFFHFVVFSEIPRLTTHGR